MGKDGGDDVTVAIMEDAVDGYRFGVLSLEEMKEVVIYRVW